MLKNKLEPRALKGIIIGYLPNSYKIQDYKLRKVIISRDIVILENNFLTTNNNNNYNNLINS